MSLPQTNDGSHETPSPATAALRNVSALVEASRAVILTFPCISRRRQDQSRRGAGCEKVSAGKAEQVKVFGFDGADDVVKLIAEKKIAATGMQFPKVIAQTAAEYADKYIKGERKFEQKVPVKVDLVTPDNVHKYGDYGKK